MKLVRLLWTNMEYLDRRCLEHSSNKKIQVLCTGINEFRTRFINLELSLCRVRVVMILETTCSTSFMLASLKEMATHF